MVKKAAKAAVAKGHPTKRSAPSAVKPAAPIRRRKTKKVADEDSDAELHELFCEDILYSIWLACVHILSMCTSRDTPP